MIKVALKGLAGRKVRALLTALAVVIGVSMVSGTYVLTDTMKKAFDGIFTESYAGTDAVINGKQLVDFSTSGRATVPAATLEQVRRLPDVQAAAGSLIDLQSNSNAPKLIDRHGDQIGRSGETLGVGVDRDGLQFTPLELTRGEWADGPREIVLDAGTASKHHYKVGDTIGVAASGPAEQYRVTGVARYGSVDSLGGASLAILDLHTAQTLFEKEGRFDSISVKAKDGVSPAALVKELKPLVPHDAEVKTGDAQAKADAKDTNDGLKFITYMLLGFGFLALFVGAFVIVNTLSITVAQRSREFATLRTLGASRRQVLRSVVLEGLIVGLLASVIGLVTGIGIAKGMNALFVAFGIDMPKSGTILATRTIVVSMLVGTLVTLIASIVPARRATRVPPITAVREGAAPESAQRRKRPYGAVATVSASLAMLALGLFGGVAGGLVALLLGVGVLSLFVGIAMLAPRLVRPIAALVGLPASRLAGAPGRIARDNSMRNPGRTASTAAALMIGLALVTVVAMLGAGLRGSTQGAVEKQVHADYVVTAKAGGGSFPAASDKAVAGSAAVLAASPVRFDQARAAGADASVSGIDAATIGRFYRFGSGVDAKALGDRDALVIKAFADDHHLRVGSALTVQASSGKKVAVTVRGIYDPPQMDQLLGQVSITQHAFDGAFTRPQNAFTFVAGSSQAALAQSVHGYPDAKVLDQDGFVKSRTDGLAMILKLLYVLLGFSVVVSLFGMVNTLVLAVYERTRELGMLRAVGMTRRQARRMIRHESIITALIGAAMGIPLGIFLSALVTQALSKYGVTLSIPVSEIAVFTVVAIVAGVLAAIIPARRASRIDVLHALQYE
jgi:putative ABC transport system permease protein